MVKLLANEFGAIVVGWIYDVLDRPTMWFRKYKMSSQSTGRR